MVTLETLARLLARAKEQSRSNSASRAQESFPLDPVAVAARVQLHLDPWQEAFLTGDTKQVLMCVARQCGKSTVAGLKAICGAMAEPNTQTLVVSPSGHQSERFFQENCMAVYRKIGRPVVAVRETMNRLRLANGSEIIAVPANPATVRGFAGVRRIIVDEAAQVSDEMYTAIRPMIAISDGDLICLSTPYGRRGWFYRAWMQEDADDWVRIHVRADQCPRYTPQRIAKERRAMTERDFESEIMAKFVDSPGQLFSAELIRSAYDDTIEPLFPVLGAEADSSDPAENEAPGSP